MKIPVIDISAIRSGNQLQQKQETANEIRRACLEHGFFCITGHGIPEQLQNDLERVSTEFFSLPLDEKMNIRMALAKRAWRGYFPVVAN